jgi:hypothetical protein
MRTEQADEDFGIDERKLYDDAEENMALEFLDK